MLKKCSLAGQAIQKSQNISNGILTKILKKQRKKLSIWIDEYEKPERLNFAIELKKEGKLIGGIDVVGYLGGLRGTPVIGYNLAQKYWGNGYMTEACHCVIEYLFSRGHTEIRIDAVSENIASIRVIQKCGGIYLKTDEEFFSLKDKTVLINRYIVKNN